MGKTLPAVNLSDTKMPTLCQKTIHVCNKIQIEKNINLDQAFKEAFDVVKAEGFMTKKFEPASRDPSLASTFKEAVEQHSTSPPLNVNVKNIFKDS